MSSKSSSKVCRSALDALVMDYLVVEGYRDAAAAFSSESGQVPRVELATVAGRMQVQRLSYLQHDGAWPRDEPELA